MPNKWTFKQPKLLKFISKFIPYNAKVLIPFAGHYRFGKIDNSIFIYNDLNLEIKADFNIEAYKLIDCFNSHYFDCIIADPPFSHFQFYRAYNRAKKKGNEKNFRIGINKWRDTADYLLKPNGIYIELGYNSVGLGKKRSKKIALGICCNGSAHNDILIVVQRKFNNLDIYNSEIYDGL